MKKVLIGLAAFTAVFWILVLGFLGTENWRGRRAWEAWKQSRETLGDSYSWAPLLPPRIPDAQNFAKVPDIEAACRVDSPISLFPDDNFHAPEHLDGWQEGQLEDLVAWEEAAGPGGLAIALNTLRPRLDAFSRASRLPASNLGMAYDQGEVPSLIGFRQAARLLRVRAVMELRQGRSDEALRDVVTGLRLARHLNAEPNLIPYLLQVAVVRITMQPIWEGLATHRWSDLQLQSIEAELAQIDALQSYRLAMQGERLTSTQGLLSMVDPSIKPFIKVKHSEPNESTIQNRFINQGWIYRNTILMDRYCAEGFIDAIDLKHHRVDPLKFQRTMNWVDSLESGFYTKIFMIARPKALEMGIVRSARTATLLDEAGLACALERFRLTNGALPERLSELVPRYLPKLPHDVITGEDLRYQKLEAGEFRLYSVGWDREDDGGQSPPPPTASEGIQESLTGDWGWPRLRKASVTQHR